MDSIKEELHYAKVPIQGKYFKNSGFLVGFNSNFLAKFYFHPVQIGILNWKFELFMKLDFPNRIFEKSGVSIVGGFSAEIDGFTNYFYSFPQG